MLIMSLKNEDATVHSLLSTYNTASLMHGAWVASFGVATLTYIGLSLKGGSSSWGVGSLAVLWVLCSSIIYNYGRMRYYACLTDCITNKNLHDPFSADIISVNKRVQELLKEEAEKFMSFSWIAYRFRKSLGIEAISMSLLIGFIIALMFFFLGLLVLEFK